MRFITIVVGLALLFGYTNCSGNKVMSSKVSGSETAAGIDNVDARLPSRIVINTANPDLRVESVSPIGVDPTSVSNLNDEIAVIDTRIPQKGFLIVYFGGEQQTKPTDSRPALEFLAGLGVHAISVDYTQSIGCADSACFGSALAEAITGIDASGAIDVQTQDGVEDRVRKLVSHMSDVHPGDGWGYYLDEDRQIKWDRVISMGHGRGASQAAYLAKLHDIARAVLLAGPSDNINGDVADWQTNATETSTDRYYTLLSQSDAGYAQAVKSERALGIDSDLEEVDVSNGVPTSSDEDQKLIVKNRTSVSPLDSQVQIALREIYRELVSPIEIHLY